jgi:AcrR family transcriptional regulator
VVVRELPVGTPLVSLRHRPGSRRAGGQRAYYYFKTKDDIIGAVVQSHVDQINSALTALERQHRGPKVRLKALIRFLAEQANSIAQSGCPHGTLSSELAKQAAGSDPLAAPLMQIPLDWAEQQFRAMGVSYQGSAVLTNALGQRELMGRQAGRLEKWIDALHA